MFEASGVRELPSRLFASLGVPVRILPLLVFAWSINIAHAGWSDFEYNFDEDRKPWEELQAQLPGAPTQANLLPFEVSAASGHRHYLDAASLTLGEDGVLRYTVVVQAAGGAQNVSFEGMRCATGERKLYAFGRRDGSWSRNRHARWEPIKFRSGDSYQRELYDSYFCTQEHYGDLAASKRLLRQGGLRRD